VSAEDRLEDFLTKRFPEFHNLLLIAGGARVAAFARENHEIDMDTVFACNAEGTILTEDAAIGIAADHLFQIRLPETGHSRDWHRPA
jgi:hypothetical protein